MSFKKFLMSLSFLAILTLGACSTADEDIDVEEETVDVNESYESDSTPSNSVESETKSESTDTEDKLKPNPWTPTEKVEVYKYKANGKPVPKNVPSDNPADYNIDGEYKPADKMSQDEIKAELEDMFGN